jgi:hypothetical protein
MSMPIAENVLRFMTACRHLQSPETFHLYMKLVKEEYEETMDAYHSRRAGLTEGESVVMLEETLDGLLDLIWVAMGAVIASGVDVNKVWDLVSHANLSKIDAATGYVKRRADGKILKPHDWQPPQHRLALLQALLDQQTQPGDYLGSAEHWNRRAALSRPAEGEAERYKAALMAFYIDYCEPDGAPDDSYHRLTFDQWIGLVTRDSAAKG